jgi:hypothetical protein
MLQAIRSYFDNSTRCIRHCGVSVQTAKPEDGYERVAKTAPVQMTDEQRNSGIPKRRLSLIDPGSGGLTLHSQATKANIRPVNTAPASSEIVQFAISEFFISEGDGPATVYVMRIGTLQGTSTVHWATMDGSAIGGLNYVEAQGTISFGPGESVKFISVEIVDDDAYDTCLAFKVVLSNPVGCELGMHKNMCHVAILDNDVFPSNDFADDIIGYDSMALHARGLALLFAYVRFIFYRVPTVKWKSCLVLLLTQLGNAYYLFTIYLKVYLVDTCLNVNDEDSLDKLPFPGDRSKSALLVGIAFVLPNIFILFSEWYQNSILEMGFVIRKFLRVSLFRKYIHYTEALHDKLIKSANTHCSQG